MIVLRCNCYSLARGLCFGSIVAIVGCVPIIAPNSAVPQLHCRMLTPGDVRFIRDGVTTKEQVLLTLGEPDYWWDHGRVYVYQWATSDIAGLWLPLPIVPIGEVGPGCLFLKNNYLLIAFNEGGNVQRHACDVDAAFHRVSLDQLCRHWTAFRDNQ